VVVRISVNTGVCIAVNLNSNIDYFGNTVNFAAKLQRCAGAGDIVLSESAYGAPGVRAWMADKSAQFEEHPFDFLGKTVQVWRWSTHVAPRLQN
jgi:class 3 adenylate cyclase